MKKLLQKMVDRIVRPPVVVITGPTASGKTSFSIGLASELIRAGKQVEIISADARQIYQEVPIFSGAISEENMKGITHHLVGSESVSEVKTAAWFKAQAEKLIDDIHARGAIPLVVGGSAFWIQGLLFEGGYPEVPPNESLRAELANYSIEQLQTMLEALDPRRSEEVDSANRRRLLRAIEVATALGEVPPVQDKPQKKWDVLTVYFNYPVKENNARIRSNVEERLSEGMEEEARTLFETLPLERIRELGLAFRVFEQYFDDALAYSDVIEAITREETRYAKRQRTFFKKMLAKLPTPAIAVTDPSQREEILTQVLGHYIRR